MCVVSMVFDHYKDRFTNPLFPWTETAPSTTNWTFTTSISPELAELRTLIAEFKEALAAAKRVDVLTKQPDCEDPEKAKLLDRVKHLEELLGNVSTAIHDTLDGSAAK